MDDSQDVPDVQPEAPQGNSTQNIQNQRQRLKWTKEMNQDIMRCFFATILRAPDQPYRKQFHQRWMQMHPESNTSEQRICDQQRQIMKKINTRENTRGSWLTEMEVQDIRRTVQANINEEQNQSIDQPNPDQNLQAEHIQPTGNNEALENNQQQVDIEPAAEQPQQPIENGDQEEIDRIRTMISGLYAIANITSFEDRYTFRKPGKRHEIELKKALQKINKAIEGMPLLTTEITDVSKLNDVTYVCAFLSIKLAGLEKQCLVRKETRRQTKKNNWQNQMKVRINNIRTDINKIEQMTVANSSSKIKRNNNIMKHKYNIQNEQSRINTLETMKQRMMALNNRLKRFTKREKQYQHNNTFENNPGKFYDEVRDNKIHIDEPPTEQDINSFWKPIFNNEQRFNQDAYWLDDYRDNVNERVVESEYQLCYISLIFKRKYIYTIFKIFTYSTSLLT